jgi:hypothetical protein
MNRGELNAFLGATGSFVFMKLVETVRIPVPRIPLGAVASTYSAKTMKLVSPAEVVIGSPSGRTTLYGRLYSP